MIHPINSAHQEAAQGGMLYFNPNSHTIVSYEHGTTPVSVSNEDEHSHQYEHAGDGAPAVICPTTIDVMCGAGHAKHHSGNELFKLVIAQYVEQYSRAQSKKVKMEVTKTILNRLTGSGVRFLKKSAVAECWHTVSPKIAKDKIGHCLRFHLSKGSQAKRSKIAKSKAPRRAAAKLSHRPSSSLFPQTSSSLCQHVVLEAIDKAASFPCQVLSGAKAAVDDIEDFVAPTATFENTTSADSSMSSQSKTEMKYFQYKDTSSTYKQRENTRLPHVGGSNFHHESAQSFNKSMYYSKAELDPYQVATHSYATNSEPQNTIHQKEHSSGSVGGEWPLHPDDKMFHYSTGSAASAPTYERRSLQSVDYFPLSPVPAAATADNKDWAQTLFFPISNTTEYDVIEPFDMSDTYPGCDEIDLFESTELALRLA